jgi:hypothetical protein
MVLVAANGQERVWLAREVFRLLAKAVKARKLYGAEHTHARASLDELHGRLGTFVEVNGALRVAITRNALLLDGETVYVEEPKEPGFAFRMFLVGGRELRFEKGVTRVELDRVVGILATPEEDDVSERFWEEELHHTELRCLNELAEGWDEPPDLSPSSLEKIKEMNRHADRIIELFRRRRTIGEGSLVYKTTDSATEFERLDRIQLDHAARDDAEDDEDLVALNLRAVQELQAEVGAAGSERLLEGVTAAVLDGLVHDPASIGERHARWFLEEAPAAALRRQNLQLLATILESFRRALKLESARVAWALDPVFAQLATDEQSRRLVQVATGRAIGGPHALMRVLATLGEKAVAIAVSAFLDAASHELKDALLVFLGKHAHLCPAALGRLVMPHVPAETARWALFLVSKNPRCVETHALYEQALSHPDKRVQEYATFLYSTQTPRGRFEAFVRALHAKDEDERIRATRKLIEIGDIEALDPLCRAVEEPGFPGRSFEEQEAFFRAIRKVGSLAAVPFLKRQAGRTSWLHPRGCETTRQLATEAIARIKRRGDTRRRVLESSTA